MLSSVCTSLDERQIYIHMNHEQPWCASPEDWQLAENEVHVWRASLEVPASSVEHLQRLLVDGEIERARRFYFEKDRRHWIVAHAVLRTLLGRYLRVEPRTLVFATNEYGKPSIASPLAERRLHFNLSHSGDLALYAFAYDKELGIDVERMRVGIDYMDLATRYFSVYERTALRALPADRQEEAFFLCWSRKEAYIKARGKGVSLPLDQFDVSLAPDEPAILLGSREEPQATERWSLHALFPGERYAGALVTEGSGWQICCWQWQK
jgi:4'-phosphopantetheinyl transferase